MPDIDIHLPGPRADNRVVVAMSGGVDSSFTAALLKAAGYDVVGITLQLYDHGEATHRSGSCCAGQDIHDARNVAAAIGIPHYVLDYESRFSETVIADFADAYIAGQTPIPCVACNQQVKFKDLLGTARELGAAAMATGHYIASRPLERVGNGSARMALYRAADADRDQSYFLFATTQAQLDYLRFPLGDLKKDAVREFANEFGLPVADKPDSQDICFVPDGRYQRVIEKLRPDAAEPGDIVHIDGQVLGTHRGIIHYTIGQRRGIGIAAGEPLYVVRLEPEQRRVIVGPRDALRVHEISLRDVNWLGDVALDAVPADGLPVQARIRSTGKPTPARLFCDARGVRVWLEHGEDGVSPGQACVFYSSADERSRVLGGGWIAGTRGGDVRAAA